MPEEMFGPYRLEELIGRGGMGEVRRAFDTVRGRMVALKRLPAALAADPAFEDRFRVEAAIASRLREPHIIPIHDFGVIDGRLYIDMRLVEGRDLATLLAAEGPLSPARATGIVAQVAAALDTAHAEGLVHRDIKPANVLVSGAESDADGEFAYVADFGIARAVSSGSTSLTATGTTIGSLDYMAPERFAGGHGDHRVDVYALGCLLFEALTARKPFAVEGVPAVINAHITTPPPRPSAHVPGLPTGLDAVVARAMAKDPEQRYASAGELATAARAAAGGASPAAETTMGGWPAGSTPAPRRRRRRGVALLSAAAAAAAIMVGSIVALAADGSGGRSDVLQEPLRSPGDNPFMPPVGTDTPGVKPPARAGGPFTGDTPGLYGGTRNTASCDADAMSEFLRTHPDKAAAWAQVEGIPPERVPSYIARLTPVVLRSDAAVTNHGFLGGRATAFQAVLQAGTAVLVDEFGVPRAKCYCGNPLTPPVPPRSPVYRGRTWAGFTPAAITTIRPARATVTEFTLVDPINGGVFVRPVGGRGSSDRGQDPATPAPTTSPAAQDPVTQQPFTPDPVQPTGGTEPPPVSAPAPRLEPPAAPSGLTATPSGPNAVVLRWADNSGGTAAYTVTYGSSNRSVPTGTSYTWDGLDPGTHACFRVDAFNAAGSTSSAEACATTPAAAQPAHTVTVSSTAGWVSTPLQLSGGQRYRVDFVSGSWSVDYRNFPSVGPDGYSDAADAQIYQACKTVQANYGLLLASTGGVITAVGSGGTFVANSSGTLQLRINDECLSDNDGSVTMTVQAVA